MPRNSQGQYFLPDGNPVVAGELVRAEWANSTLTDVANALTNSLDRAGAGGMTGQLKAAAGTQVRPGISFVEDPATGIYKESQGVMAMSANGVKQAYVTQNGLFVSTAPSDRMEVANKAYVDSLASQATEIILAFGASKTPADLPSNGYIPANWDATGSPFYAVQFSQGQAAVYRPTNTSDPLYNHVYVFVSTNTVSTGWIDIGTVAGPPGPQGETGPAGPPGPDGPIGPSGPTGATGPLGPVGPTGAQGPIGPQGDQGVQGATGEQGPQGAQGIQGPIGPQGTTGEVGPKGDTGAQGIQGPQGPQGQQGQQGSPGASAVIIGTFGVSKTPADLPVSGLIPANWDAPGSPPNNYQMTSGEALAYTDCPNTTPNYGHVYEYVNQLVSDYDPNNWIDLGDIVGPQGPKGDTGAQGAAGATGATGAQGPKGDDGAVGPQGLQGVKGDQGATGATGPKGDTGVQGPQGVQGNAGPQGPEGTPGATGPQGPQGNVGDRGLQGDPGPTGPQGIKGDTGATGPQGVQGPQGPEGPSGGVASVNGMTGAVTLNYNSVGSPSTTGVNATGTTWNISVLGSAAKWTTARTISLTGPITGTATMDGSANVSIATTTSGLPTLAGTQTWSGVNTFSQNILINKVGSASAIGLGGTGQKCYVANNSTETQTSIAANGTPGIIIDGGGAVISMNWRLQSPGYASRAGTTGAYGANNWNMFWTANTMQLWVDTQSVGTINVTSDYRVKKDVATYTASDALSRIGQLRPVTYEFKEFGNLFVSDGIVRDGFIAHELQAVIPSAVVGEKDAPNQLQSLKLDALCAVMVAAIQELKAEVDALKAQVQK